MFQRKQAYSARPGRKKGRLFQAARRQWRTIPAVLHMRALHADIPTKASHLLEELCAQARVQISSKLAAVAWGGRCKADDPPKLRANKQESRHALAVTVCCNLPPCCSTTQAGQQDSISSLGGSAVRQPMRAERAKHALSLPGVASVCQRLQRSCQHVTDTMQQLTQPKARADVLRAAVACSEYRRQEQQQQRRQRQYVAQPCRLMHPPNAPTAPAKPHLLHPRLFVGRHMVERVRHPQKLQACLQLQCVRNVVTRRWADRQGMQQHRHCTLSLGCLHKISEAMD